MSFRQRLWISRSAPFRSTAVCNLHNAAVAPEAATSPLAYNQSEHRSTHGSILVQDSLCGSTWSLTQFSFPFVLFIPPSAHLPYPLHSSNQFPTHPSISSSPVHPSIHKCHLILPSSIPLTHPSLHLSASLFLH